MKRLRLVQIGDPDVGIVESVVAPLREAFDVPCAVDTVTVDPSVAYHPERDQYHSSELIEMMEPIDDGLAHILGIAPVDLYIPILTYVFGEAQVGGRIAVVSYHRLRQTFYGLPPNPDLLRERLVKECLHEIGHTRGLHHCHDYECVMASAFSVERIDIRNADYCDDCRAQVGAKMFARVAE